MKKINFLTFILGCLCSIATLSAQTVSLTFTGKDSVNRYVQLNKVVVTNLTKSWQETIYWPDTVLTLTNKTGISDVQEQEIGLFSYPNPFNGTSSVLLTIPQSQEVNMAVYNITGQRVMEFSSQLEAGTNHFDIGFQKPQVYFLVVNTLEGRLVQKLVNVGHSGDNYIKFRSTLPLSEEQNSKIQKRQSSQPFSYGDMMEYVGYATINGNMEESQRITQAQGTSQTFSLQFNATQPTTLPILSTITASNITETSAVSGGNITSDGGSQVTARGVCWSTSHNPTINGNHTTDGSGIGNFTSNITNLTGNTTYYVRAYAINANGTAYGNEVSFSTSGASGVASFSVSATTQVVFSPGNLQWSATNGGNAAITHAVVGNGEAAGTWRFAPNQWDTIGIGNNNISSTYTGWIDLFGWGTSGYDSKYPYKTDTINSSYGNGNSNISGTNYDWGVYNAIYNPKTQTTNAPGTWRTLTKDEWEYLLNTRVTSSGIRYAKGRVMGRAGVIIVPDNWSAIIYPLRSINSSSAGYDSNTITYADWPMVEAAGCVFLPAAGRHLLTSVGGVGSYGGYWSSAFGNSPFAYNLEFFWNWYYSEGDLYLTSTSRHVGHSVRLVRNAGTVIQNLPIVVTTVASSITSTTATSGGNITNDGGSTITSRGICWSTSPNPVRSNSHTTNGSGTGSFTSSITGLKGGTTYYVRAYATNASGTAYGNQIVFTTSAILPTVTTTTVSSITPTTAISGGNVTNSGGVTVTARGVCWDTTPNPTINKSRTNNGSGTGSFTSNITGLSADKTYYVRAYATNSVGTSYGNQVSFTTTNITIPMLTTTIASNITDSSAVSGGNITNSGGTSITARGVCWSTSPNPTISNSHTTNGSSMGSFTSNITGLKSSTIYYVRAYATNAVGTAYGNEVSFITPATLANVQFSISSTQKVLFSPGNLQWSATNGGNSATTHIVAGNGRAAGTWRFAPNQWDTIGVNNSNISSNYTGWIDLFGWGTSGYNNKHPYMISTNEADYYNGNDISGTNYDWGVYNAIYNLKTQTTDAPGTWRTLTKDEWEYIMNDRSTLSGIRYAKATVNGVEGLIIVPDYWKTSIYTLNNVNITSAAFTSNIISIADWANMEATGCVFLPATGQRSGTSVGVAGYAGSYWSATCNNSDFACRLLFNSSSLNPSYRSSRYYGYSVRLVRSADIHMQGFPMVTTMAVGNITDTSAIIGGNVSDKGGAAVTARGVCWDTISNPTISGNYTIDGSDTGSFSSHITGLIAGKTYYVRAYATNAVGTAYGNVVFLTTSTRPNNVQFSVSSTQKVVFSPGNLQWSATNGDSTATIHAVAGNDIAAGTWRFSPHQWDTIGIGNNNISSTYTGWIDCFGWGTSGYNNKYPYMTSTTNSDYGNGNNNISGTNYDWGEYNAIYNPQTNMTDVPGTWRTLTKNEWNYLLNTRSTASGIRYAKATVNGVTGLIIVPDNWDNTTIYHLDSTNLSAARYASNSISYANWVKIENAGAVFLPAANYWSTTYYDGKNAYYLNFSSGNISSSYNYYRYGRLHVRLVLSANVLQDIPIVTTTEVNSITDSSAISGGSVIADGGYSITARGVCWDTIPNPTISSNHTSDSIGIGSYTSYMTGLIIGKTYYVRAYATNAVGTSYGIQVSFTATTKPTLTTKMVSNIIGISAISGGNIVNEGGSSVIARGVCWDTIPNPTISSNHTSDSIGIGSYTSYMTGLIIDKTYYVRAYATNVDGTSYGNQIVFTTYSSNLYSVSDTTKVKFSPGNLQWSATNGGNTATTHVVANGTAAGTWRFAPHQWDTIGANNSNIDSSYTGWIDLFGWGTNGYNNKYPYMTSNTNADYGNGNNNISCTYYDWGVYNAIYNPSTNTTDAPGRWRTLTKDEWDYLMNTRTTSSGINYAKAKVNGVSGLIIVPDNWMTSIYTLDSTNVKNATYSSNVINLADWDILEAAGCIFLPATGYRYGTSVDYVGSYGYYWSSTYYGSGDAYCWSFGSSVNYSSHHSLLSGNSVRLVTVINPTIPILTSSVYNITDTSVICGGNIITDGCDSIIARGVCWSTSQTPTINDNYILDSSGIGSYTCNIIGLIPGTTYYLRAFATNAIGTAYGNEIAFIAIAVPQAQFSVSSTQKVLFSPGNLQWSFTNGGNIATTHIVAGNDTAAGTWRFAPNQWDTIGANNSNISSTYTGWIDLFCWGTSGYNNKYPYMISNSSLDYGNGNNNISGTNYDWGVYNAIYNPQTQMNDGPGVWRTLTKSEWNYLLHTRSTTSGVRYAKATVNGVAGLIILPDNWIASTYVLDSTDKGNVSFTSNVISATNWTILEHAGCVFLPAAGNHYGTSVGSVGSCGNYWSATYYTSNEAYYLVFYSNYVSETYYIYRSYGYSVRLVRDVQ